MRFIPKQKQTLTESVQELELKEAEANPLEKAVEISSEDEAYKQAILKAIGSETAADVEYSQILQLEENVSDELKNTIHDTIVDIRNEEIKHIAQLTEKVSELPDMKEQFEAGRKEAETGEDKKQEEVKEAVQEGRGYDVETIKQVIAEYLDFNTDQYIEMEDIINPNKDELSAEEVDSYLAEIVNAFNLTPQQLHQIEINIVNTTNPAEERIAEFKDDIESDIDSIDFLCEKVYTVAAKEKLQEVIAYLKTLEYNGDINTGWTQRHNDPEDYKYKGNIVR